MNPFIKNLKAIEAKDPDLAKRLRRAQDDPSIQLLKERGVVTGIEVSCEGGATVQFKHERLVGNVRRITEKKLFSFSEVIILAGIGLGETLGETLQASGDGAFVLVIEPSLAFFKRLIECVDLAELLSDSRVSVSVGEDPYHAVMKRLEDQFTVFTRPNFQVIRNVLAAKCHREYFSQLDLVLARQKAMAEANLRAITRLSLIWQENVMANLGHILRNPGIIHLFGKLQGVPAVIVAAGPSLDKNCRWLKMAEKSAVIICVDTALKTLLKNGVRPHIVVALDALVHNYFHVTGALEKGFTLVVNPVTYPLILQECEGPMMLTSYSEPLVGWLEQFTGDLGVNITGGSVATSAFDLAMRMGCSPIILTGQDLAFTGRRTHSGGGANEEMIYSLAAEPQSADSLHGEAIGWETMSQVEGNLGHPLASSVKMNTWKNWFEIRIEQSSVDCINATEGGAVIKGARAKCLAEALGAVLGTAKHIRGILHAARPLQLPADAGGIRKRFDRLAARAREIKKICSLAIKEAEKLAHSAQRRGEESVVQSSLRMCGSYMNLVMGEREFLEINQWRFENTMDKIHRIRSGVKTSDDQKEAYLNAESYLIFFRDAYRITKDFEKNIRFAGWDVGYANAERGADAV